MCRVLLDLRAAPLVSKGLVGGDGIEFKELQEVGSVLGYPTASKQLRTLSRYLQVLPLPGGGGGGRAPFGLVWLELLGLLCTHQHCPLDPEPQYPPPHCNDCSRALSSVTHWWCAICPGVCAGCRSVWGVLKQDKTPGLNAPNAHLLGVHQHKCRNQTNKCETRCNKYFNLCDIPYATWEPRIQQKNFQSWDLQNTAGLLQIKLPQGLTTKRVCLFGARTRLQNTHSHSLKPLTCTRKAFL